MNKIKNVLLPVLFVVLTSFILVLGFSRIGLLPEIKLPDIKFPAVTDVINNGTDKTVIKSNVQLIEELRFELMNNGDHKNSLSSDMIALWVNINEDFSFEDTSDAEDIKYAVYSDFDYYRNFIPNTIFIRPDTAGTFDGIKETNGADFDILSYVLYYTNDLKCDAVLVADESVLFNSKGELSTDTLNKFLSAYSFDGVLLSCETLFGNNKLFDITKKISSFISGNYPEVSFGVEVQSDSSYLFADQTTIDIFENGLCDFGYVDCNYTTSDKDYPFRSVAYWWNTFSDYYGVPFYCEHRADKIFSNAEEWESSTEINEQLKALYDCPTFDGSCFYSVSAIKNKKLLARDLSIFLNDVSETRQDAMSVESLVIDSVNNEVSFTGKVEKDAAVYCSQNILKNDEGTFSVKFPLDQSVNIFDFKSNGAQYTYIIENNMDLITSYYPSESIIVNNNSTLHTYAVSPVGAQLYAVINGNVFSLSAASPPDNFVLPSGFAYYSCDISLNKMDFDSAELSLFCYYNGNYFTAECGYVSQNKINFQDDINSADSHESDNIISPYTDNGLGASVLCKINCDNTEQIGKANDYDTYRPYNSALLKGTIDYLDKIDVTPEGYLVYELKSGINVYGVDCVLINNGYNLPLNNVVLSAFDDAQADSTVFTFDLDWLSPITVSPQPQDYKVGYRNFSYNISEFNAQYVDINFYHSNPVVINNSVSFDINSVFSSYELFAAESNSYIMRLYLKNPGKFYGFNIIHNTDGSVSVVFQKRADNSLNGKTIMLDPGHGGISMVGTAVSDNSVSESKVTLNMAYYVKQYLEKMGATVIMTRTADTSLPLSERTFMCETQNPDIFVSIHCDGAESNSENGTHTFYFTPFSQPLAKWIHTNLVNAYSEKIYTESDENFKNIDRKIKYYPFYVTRVDNCPAVLVETGFMTNYVEGNVLINPANQEILASAIAQGIADYFYYS